MLPLKPTAPFDNWPIQVADAESEMFLWFLEPNLFLVKYHAPTYTLTTAQRVLHYIDTARAARRDEIARAGGFVAIHDARFVRKSEPEAQKYLNAAWKKLTPHEVKAGYVIVADNLPAVAMAALNFVNIVAAFATGKTMKILRHHAEPFAVYGVTAPSPSAVFPGQEVREK